MKRWITRAGLVLFGCIVAFAAGEWIAAHSGVVDTPPGLFVEHPTRSFANRPGFKGRDRRGNPIRINSMGLRNPEISLDKPAGVMRVLVLGDSVAFGDGVREEEAFPARLEGLLNAGGTSRWQVINGGVRGYNTVMEKRLFEEVGLRYQPDWVVLAYVLNDAEPLERQGGMIDPRHRTLLAIKNFAKEHFYLYSLLRKVVELWRWQQGPMGAMETYEAQFAPDHPGWRASEEAVEDIRDLAAQANARFLFAVLPVLGKAAPETQAADEAIRRRVVALGKRLGVRTLDFQPLFGGTPGRDAQIEERDTFHPNPTGHRMIAEALEKEIMRPAGEAPDA
ncbi:MAG: SGNH/GDSL hydrolase family protein [Candidatus Omnitrophica bacterium]|nr:SGNH/GDSL hydrolase family protein [Candidatus Omnitrophota bacterium]